MEDDDAYDEFGNYIGPERREPPPPPPPPSSPPTRMEEVEEESELPAVSSSEPAASTAVVLHEDKNYYASAESVYGHDVETLVEEEDAQTLATPIVSAVTTTTLHRIALRDDVDASLVSPLRDASLSASLEYFSQISATTPSRLRNVAVVGHLHHGKTSLISMLSSVPADTRRDESEISMSVKSRPLSLLIQTRDPPQYHAITAVVAPGHSNLQDESVSACAICDGFVICVDAVEGPMMVTETVVRHCVGKGLPMVVVITKVDRLITELRLPPSDAFFKIKNVLNRVQTMARSYGSSEEISPSRGNVLLSSAKHGWCFSLLDFADVYSRKISRGDVSRERMAERLWGDWYLSSDGKRITRDGSAGSGKRTFVELVLEPLYKAYSMALGGAGPRELWSVVAREFGLRYSSQDLPKSVVAEASKNEPTVSVVLRMVLSKAFDSAGSFAEAVVRFVPSAESSQTSWDRRSYTGDLRSLESLGKDSAVCFVTKLTTHEDDATKCYALTRVSRGTLVVGQKVKVLGEAFAPGVDEEDCSEAVITGIYVPYGCGHLGHLRVESAHAGQIVLVDGVDSCITKTATLLAGGAAASSPLFPYRPLEFRGVVRGVMKVAVEPLNPAELPKIVEGLRRIVKSYPASSTRKEDSGEHALLGTGEVQLDCMLRDLREAYTGGAEIRVSDPVTCFCETVAETSDVKCFAKTPNRKSKISAVAEPLEKGLAEESEACEGGNVVDSKKLREKYGWDLLAVKSLWTLGANALLDETLLEDEERKKDLAGVRRHIVQGFEWAMREGPLCEEPVRRVKVRLVGADLAPDDAERSGAQLITASRRVCYSAILTASPRLMEPVLVVEIESPHESLVTVIPLLTRRRGRVISEYPLPGTPLHVVRAYLPAIESFGFETDVRTHTLGQAFCLQTFDHWEVVPGDPLDRGIVLRPLEPSPLPHLAREFMIKTRKRKGLSEDVSPAKVFDEELLALFLARN